MKQFGEWFRDWGKEAEAPERPWEGPWEGPYLIPWEEVLEDAGFVEVCNSLDPNRIFWVYKCCGCQQMKEVEYIPQDREELRNFLDFGHYCGGSPRCIP